MRVRVLVADDHNIIRQGLSALIAKEKDMEVVGEAEDGRAAVKLAGELKPHVVVMDIGMKHLNGIEATRQILAARPNVKVVALSMHSDQQFVSSMLEAGASGYLLKDCAFEELTTAVRTVIEGKTYLSPPVAGTVVADYIRKLSSSQMPDIRHLTGREREVLQLMAEGSTTKEIAYQFSVSVKTVETHRRNIMGKLNIHSVAKLTKYAIRQGLTSLDG